MPDASGTETPAEVRYKVGEICRLADVQPYVLRYWENEFPILAADRTQSGPRMYSERDLAVIQRIKTLLYVEGFTIAGAKKRLENELKNGGPAPEVPRSEQAGTAPVPVVPPPLPAEAAAPQPKPRRTRTRPVAVSKGGDEIPEIFEEEVTDAPAEEAAPAEKKGDPRTGVVAQPSDPRLPRVVSELKKVLEILSREP